MGDELWQTLQEQQRNLMDPLTAFSASPIKGTFVVHFMLVTWSLITTDWMPHVFIYYNLVFYLCLLWSLHAIHNPEPVQLAAILNLLSVLLDVMCIATNYENAHNLSWFGFSLFLIICNLVLRPITSILLLRVYNDRTDRFGSFGAFDARPAGGPFGFGAEEARTGGYSPGGEISQRAPLMGQGGYQNLDPNYSSQPNVVASKPSSGYQAVPGPIDSP